MAEVRALGTGPLLFYLAKIAGALLAGQDRPIEMMHDDNSRQGLGL
jgi:hypothetical protein